MSWWIPVVVVVAALWAAGTYVWIRGRRYRAVFHKDHVREVLLALGPLGQAALTRCDAPLLEEGDPRLAVTSAGLILSYTTERRNEVFVHRLMLRHGGGVTTYSVARRFLALALTVFDPDGECDRISMSPERVFVAEWIVGQERQARLNAAGYALPPGRTDEEIRAAITAADARAARLGQALTGPDAVPIPPG